MEVLQKLFQQAGLFSLSWQNIVMFIVSGTIIYLAVKKNFEPLLLVPIGFGALLANLPLAELSASGSFQGEHVPLIQLIYNSGIKTELLPPVIFMGVGALTDFRPLLSRPITFLL